MKSRTKKTNYSRSYESDFSPSDYLKFYYSGDINGDEKITYKHIIELLKKRNVHFQKMLEIGCGPTLHNIIPFIPFVDEIHMADYLPSNLEKIQEWIHNVPTAHNWDNYIEGVLKLENNLTSLNQRKLDIRSKITQLRHIDLKKELPLGDQSTYPLVTAFYCAASATSSKKEWKDFMDSIIKHIDPGGMLIVSDFRSTDQYHVGDKIFPNAHIDEFDMKNYLTSNQVISKNSISITPLVFEGWEHVGLSGFMIATALTKV